MLKLFKRKSADQALADLVARLAGTMGSKLVSVLLYGSKVSGEFREGKSDVNVLILLEDASSETLQQLATPIKPWIRAGFGWPVFLPERELVHYARNLPIEFLDMVDHHKVLFGQDPLIGLGIDRAHLKAQCAQELSVKLLRLRRAMISAPSEPAKLRDLVIQSLPSLLTLFRAVHRLDGDAAPGDKLAAAKNLARQMGADTTILDRLFELREGAKEGSIVPLAAAYIDLVARVFTHVSSK